MNLSGFGCDHHCEVHHRVKPMEILPPLGGPLSPGTQIIADRLVAGVAAFKRSLKVNLPVCPEEAENG